jgi:hypothetical protein
MQITVDMHPDFHRGKNVWTGHPIFDLPSKDPFLIASLACRQGGAGEALARDDDGGQRSPQGRLHGQASRPDQGDGPQSTHMHLSDPIHHSPILHIPAPLKILLSTDTEVWAKMTWPGFADGVIKHYVFDDQGHLPLCPALT